MRRIFLKTIGALMMLSSPMGSQPAAQPWREKMLERRRNARGMADDTEDSDGPLEPAALPAGVDVIRNIAYGPDPAQRLDVYRPARAENAPVIFMVHGGGWMRGDKA